MNEKEYTQPIVIKNSLNLTKGEAGGLSEIKSNPKRGQVSKPCISIVNEIRDQLSNKTVSKNQFKKKRFYSCRHKTWVKLPGNFKRFHPKYGQKTERR